jgi:hypothetical protein
MAKGQLQCMGSAIHLKKKFGAVRRSHRHSLLSVSDLKSCHRPQGYQITVAVKRETRGAVTEFFESQIEGA